MRILVVNFNLAGVNEQQYEGLCDQIAPAFAAVPGLVSKTWIKNAASGTYGGVYLFRDGEALDQFRRSDLFKGVQSHPNLANVTAMDFEVQEAPTRVTHGLAPALA